MDKSRQCTSLNLNLLRCIILICLTWFFRAVFLSYSRSLHCPTYPFLERILIQVKPQEASKHTTHECYWLLQTVHLEYRHLVLLQRARKVSSRLKTYWYCLRNSYSSWNDLCNFLSTKHSDSQSWLDWENQITVKYETICLNISSLGFNFVSFTLIMATEKLNQKLTYIETTLNFSTVAYTPPLTFSRINFASIQSYTRLNGYWNSNCRYQTIRCKSRTEWSISHTHTRSYVYNDQVGAIPNPGLIKGLKTGGENLPWWLLGGCAHPREGWRKLARPLQLPSSSSSSTQQPHGGTSSAPTTGDS